MSDSRHRIIALAAGMLILAALACQAPQQTPPTIVPVTLPPASTPTPPGTTFPTVVPIATSTVVPTPAASPSATATTSGASGGTPTATATPSGPAAKLEFTADNITYALTPRRKGDNKVRLTITLHPTGGLPPYSFILDDVTPVSGLTYTFDWHNCKESEPHTIVLFSADGQKTKPVGFIPPYDC